MRLNVGLVRAFVNHQVDYCDERSMCDAPTRRTTIEDTTMSKGLDKKKEQKKKPAKTLKEKRAEKNDKKATRGFAPT
jgi:hypothetical protein